MDLPVAAAASWILRRVSAIRKKKQNRVILIIVTTRSANQADSQKVGLNTRIPIVPYPKNRGPQTGLANEVSEPFGERSGGRNPKKPTKWDL